MTKLLTTAIQTIQQNPEKDSPIYSFFADLEPPARKKIQQAVARSAPAAAGVGESAPNPTMSVLMEQANAAIANSDFATAKTLLTLIRPMAPKDPYVAQRFALATYKGKKPDALQALTDAKAILEELSPEVSTDTETLGQWGAVHKRLWDLTKKKEDLETSIFAYEKGFYLKNDYYNGINLAFLYNVRASVEAAPDAIADAVIAKRTRQRVLTICQPLLNAQQDNEQKYWILATMAEACVGMEDEAGAEGYLQQAAELKPAAWMIESTQGQLQTLRGLMKAAPVNRAAGATP